MGLDSLRHLSGDTLSWPGNASLPCGKEVPVPGEICRPILQVALVGTAVCIFQVGTGPDFPCLFILTGAVEQRPGSRGNCLYPEGPRNAGIGQSQVITAIAAARWSDPSIHMEVRKPLLRDIN